MFSWLFLLLFGKMIDGYLCQVISLFSKEAL